MDAKAELVKFLTLSTGKGYEFKTVDTYLTDQEIGNRFYDGIIIVIQLFVMK